MLVASVKACSSGFNVFKDNSFARIPFSKQESAFVDSFYRAISMESAPVSHHPHRMIPPLPETQVEIPEHNQTRSSLHT